MPLEFDFRREASNASAVRSVLKDHSEHLPLLRKVAVPMVLPLLSTSRLLTMEYVDGVPLLDIKDMDLALKQDLMSALVRRGGIASSQG